jgi:hypothetical protein
MVHNSLSDFSSPPRMSDSDSSLGISDAESAEPLLPSVSRAESRLASIGFLQISTAGYEKASLLSPYGSLGPTSAPLRTPRTPKTPSTELNTLPETSSVGRNLNWSSAYFLIISRVIGSGIFATPGVIAKSTGSIGLALLLWFLGAVISACGLGVSLELGCMLPRSGGEKVGNSIQNLR